MSPLPNLTHVQVRADEMAIQTVSSSTLSASIATSDLSSPTLISTTTQESPCQAASTGGLVTDSSTPPLSNPPSLPSTFIVETPTAQPSPYEESGITFGSKLGLGMIPVILILCCAWIFFLFWWRRRKARKDVSLPPPPVPEKDGLFRVPSLDGERRGSKVFNMAAFSTPIHGRWRQAQVYRESSLLPQHRESETRNENDRRIEQNQQYKRSDSYSDIIRLANSGSARPSSDSPIDLTSPFPLERGDTVRKSLGSEISSLWPSPPPEVWVKRSNDTERLQSPTFSVPGSLRRARFCGEDYEPRTYSSSERYA
jgi:hypothetical protein